MVNTSPEITIVSLGTVDEVSSWWKRCLNRGSICPMLQLIMVGQRY